MTDRFLTAKAVTDKLKISFAIFTFLQQRRDFPKKKYDECGKARWLESEVDHWLRARPRHESFTRRRRFGS